MIHKKSSILLSENLRKSDKARFISPFFLCLLMGVSLRPLTVYGFRRLPSAPRKNTLPPINTANLRLVGFQNL